MMFADPLAVECPRCGAVSRHNSADLLALRSVCPACGSPVDDIGRRVGAGADEWAAFCTWADVRLGVEERLGITPPGIPDGPVFGTEPHAELALLDLVRAVAGHAPPGAEASRLVLESARRVAGRPVPAADMGRPILRAVSVPDWAARHAEPGAAADGGA